MADNEKFKDVKAPVEVWILRDSMAGMTDEIKELQAEVAELKKEVEKNKGKDGVLLVLLAVFVIGMMMLNSKINSVPFEVLKRFCLETALGQSVCIR